jgi:hypothetical protein
MRRLTRALGHGSLGLLTAPIIFVVGTLAVFVAGVVLAIAWNLLAMILDGLASPRDWGEGWPVKVWEIVSLAGGLICTVAAMLNSLHEGWKKDEARELRDELERG